MRPVPKSRHGLAAVLLLGVAVLSAAHAGLQGRISDRQLRTAAIVVSADDPRGFADDGLLGSGALRRRSAPAWPWLVGQFRAATGYELNLAEWFAPAAFPLTAVFLLGMYGLLWRQCLSWKAACLGAVLSLVVIEPVASMPWGAGTLRMLNADGLVVAMIPLVCWVLWLKGPRPVLLWAFVGVGLLANFSFIAAASLAALLAVVWLARRRPGPRDWLVVPIGLLTALVAAAPTLLLWWNTAEPGARTVGVLNAMALNGPAIPPGVAGMLTGLFDLNTLARLLVLAIPATAVAVGFERFHVRNLRLWLAMLLACAVMATAFTITAAADDDARAIWLLAAGNFIRLTLLPLYVLLTQALVHFSRGAMRRTLFWALAVMAAFWLAPSDNLSWPRHQIEDMASSLMPAESRPQNVQNREARREMDAELRAIGQWLRLHCPRGGLVICEQAELRLYAERPLVIAEQDLSTRVLLDGDRGATARQLFNRQRDLLNPPDGRLDIERLEAFAAETAAEAVVAPAWSLENASGPRWPLPEDGAWGARLRIFLPRRIED